MLNEAHGFALGQALIRQPWSRSQQMAKRVMGTSYIDPDVVLTVFPEVVQWGSMARVLRHLWEVPFSEASLTVAAKEGYLLIPVFPAIINTESSPEIAFEHTAPADLPEWRLVQRWWESGDGGLTYEQQLRRPFAHTRVMSGEELVFVHLLLTRIYEAAATLGDGRFLKPYGGVGWLVRCSNRTSHGQQLTMEIEDDGLRPHPGDNAARVPRVVLGRVRTF